jgi:hypothetical protein
MDATALSHLVGSLRRWYGELVDRAAPARWVPLAASLAPRRVALVCVYRRRHASVVRRLIQQLPVGAVVRLWALDEAADGLLPYTVGSGPGGRMAHLNALTRDLPADVDCLVVADDDVRFVVGDLGRLLRAGAALDLDVFQPAHSARSRWSFPFVRKHPMVFARQTRFVEQGPLVVLSARAQAALLPFPENTGMGWGVEASWSATATEHGLRLGIVDAVAIRHLSEPGHAYDTEAELLGLRRELAALGLSDLRELQVATERVGVVSAWRRGRARAHRAARS